MSAIEDILNAADSGDEDDLAIDGLDLDTLLEDSDGDEEYTEASGCASVVSGGTDTPAPVRRTDPSLAHSNNASPTSATVSSRKPTMPPFPPTATAVGSLPTIATKFPVRDDRSSMNDGGQTTGDTSDDMDDISDGQYNESVGVAESASRRTLYTMSDGLRRIQRREVAELQLGLVELPSTLMEKMNSDGESQNAKLSSIKLHRLEAISAQLRKNQHFQRHGPGIARCLYVVDGGTDALPEGGVHVAVGTSKGLVLLFAGQDRGLSQVLGSAVADRNTTAVRCIVKPPVGETGTELIICGHADGEIALWDASKGSIIRRIRDLHSGPVVRARCLLPSSSERRGQIQVITVDNKGVSYLSRIARNRLWPSYSIESECILDGSAGPILELAVTEERILTGAGVKEQDAQSAPPSSHPPLVALISAAATYIVTVTPSIKVVQKWPLTLDNVCEPTTITSHTNKTSDDDSGGDCLKASTPPLIASLDWRANEGAFDLLRTCNSRIEYITYRNTDAAAAVPASPPAATGAQTVLSIPHSDRRDTFIFSACWLPQRSGVLVMTNQSVLVIGTGGTAYKSVLLHDHGLLIASILEGDDGLARGILPAMVQAHPEGLHVLMPDALFRVYLQPWSERVDGMVGQGRWLDALAAAAQQSEATRDNSTSTRSALGSLLAKYLRGYMDLSLSGDRSQCAMVAKVCMDFCLCTGLKDLIFDDVYAKFGEAHQQPAFFEVLGAEHFAGRISAIPTALIRAMLTSHAHMSRHNAMERCLVSLANEATAATKAGVSSEGPQIDLAYLSAFGVTHALYTGLVSILSLVSRAGAFKVLFELLIRSPNETRQATIRGKLLLFVLYTLEGRPFPEVSRHEGDSGEHTKSGVPLPPSSSSAAQWACSDGELMQLIRLLTMRTYDARPSPGMHTTVCAALAQVQASTGPIVLPIAHEYPYLSALASHDSSSFFFMVRAAIRAMARRRQVAMRKGELTLQLGSWLAGVFSFAGANDTGSTGRAQRQMLEWTHRDILACNITPPREMCEALLRFLGARTTALPHIETSVKGLCVNLDASATSWILPLLKECGFWRAALEFSACHHVTFLSTEESDTTSADGGERSGMWTDGDFRLGVDSYLACKAGPVQESVFDFIHRFFAVFPHRCRAEVPSLLKALPFLFDVSSDRLRRVASDHLSQHVDAVIDRTRHQPSLQFVCLDAIASWALQSESTSPGDERVQSTVDGEGSPLQVLFNPEHLTQYIRLLALCEPGRVHSVLKRCSVDSYHANETLAVCESKGIFDGTCLLLCDTKGADVAMNYALSELAKLFKSQDNGREMDADHTAKVRHVADICQQSTGDPNVLWVKALEFFLESSQARSEEVGDPHRDGNGAGADRNDEHSTIALASTLLREFVGLMRMHVRAYDILSNIKGMYLGDFRDILQKMSYADIHDTISHQACHGQHRADVYALLKERLRARRRAQVFQNADDARAQKLRLLDDLEVLSLQEEGGHLRFHEGDEGAGASAMGARQPGALMAQPLFSAAYTA